jgi:hypothetical protein
MKRVEVNNEDYITKMKAYSNSEMFGLADDIATVSDAHRYMTEYHHYSEDELDFFLLFQNPLDLVADNWYERRSDLSDVQFAIDWIYDHRDDYITDYPLIADDDEINRIIEPQEIHFKKLADKHAEIRKPPKEIVEMDKPLCKPNGNQLSNIF